jgi:serine beta-lactamase-like protein LACTB, mitochondrial
MSKNTKRLRTSAARIGLTAGGLLAAIVGFATYTTATTTSVHWQPQSVPSVVRSEPSPQWSGAADRARHVMRAALAEQNLPGLSVAVGVGADIVWAEGFGWADIKARVRVTPDTRFKIGTASTVLTSAAVGVLLQKNQLKLDDEIQAYVPQFPKKSRAVTLRQLMGHVAGITTDSGDEGPLLRERCERPVDALQYFADGELLFEPGTQYRYSRYGWILVSAAIEAAAHQPFLTFMQEDIFRPLRMDDTGAESATEENPEHAGEPGEDAPFITLIRKGFLEPLGIVAATPTEKTPDQATFYSPIFGAHPGYGVHVTRPHNLSCYAGSMAFFSTPADLVRFGLAMNTGTLLQRAAVRLFQMSQRLTSGQETGYGLGWDLETVALGGEPAHAAGHDGKSSGGRMVTLLTFRERGIVVAVMSNISYADTSSLARQVAQEFDQQRRSVSRKRPPAD